MEDVEYKNKFTERVEKLVNKNDQDKCKPFRNGGLKACTKYAVKVKGRHRRSKCIRGKGGLGFGKLEKSRILNIVNSWNNEISDGTPAERPVWPINAVKRQKMARLQVF